MVDELLVAVTPKPPCFDIKRRLARGERQLMHHEQVEHLGDSVQHGFSALRYPLLPVEPWPEALVEIMTRFALQPGT